MTKNTKSPYFFENGKVNRRAVVRHLMPHMKIDFVNDNQPSKVQELRINYD